MGNDFESGRTRGRLLDRRRFMKGAGMAGLGAAAATLALGNVFTLQARTTADTVKEIFTAALIAEDLATTFYYNGLVGPVIQDPNLAGSGGSANDVASNGNAGNVNYLQAALSEEISHADLLRGLLAGPPGSVVPPPSKDPVQTFYFPAGSFVALGPFLELLDALESAFIGAYMTAVEEFATRGAASAAKPGRSPFKPRELAYFAKVASSILGVESEHRVLGRVIGNMNPANNLCYEKTDGLTTVYNGPHSAVVALTPFLSARTGPGYSFADALSNASTVSLPCTGGPPSP